MKSPFAFSQKNSTRNKMATIPTGSEAIIQKADSDICLGSGELKACPFCGCWAISVGSKNEQSGYFGYKVICTGLHHCGATIHSCSETLDDARKTAVENWNKRAIPEPQDDPQYQQIIVELAKMCKCSHDQPCEGLLAGGLCDNAQHGDDSGDENYRDEE